MLYHLKFGWAEGGLLGVGVFFTLSGYLITDILLNQMNRGFTSPGYAARSRPLADALLEAFPNTHPLTMTDEDNCVVPPSS